MVYTTYVSEASISQIKDMVFEKDNYFGLLVGYLNGEYSKKGILEVKTYKLYLYYADYSISEEDFEKIVKLDVYYLGSEQGGIILSNGMIQKTFKNLTGTLEKILINN